MTNNFLTNSLTKSKMKENMTKIQNEFCKNAPYNIILRFYNSLVILWDYLKTRQGQNHTCEWFKVHNLYSDEYCQVVNL